VLGKSAGPYLFFICKNMRIPRIDLIFSIRQFWQSIRRLAVKAIIGRKIGMTQVLQEDGVIVPVTVIQAGPCTVVDVKTDERDGYQAIQLGFESSSKINKAQIGQSKKLKVTPKVRREVRLSNNQTAPDLGETIDVTRFVVGERVTVQADSKGKGFAGTIKRHNFARGPMTHGSRNIREPGSIGSMYPQKIFKGHPMAGQMGGVKTTVKNQVVTLIDEKRNVIAVRGTVPGAMNGLVVITGGAS
jgi:large subunit ribosomal protein L3